MIKIFNIDMAIYYLEKDEDNVLCTCGAFQDVGEKITFSDIEKLKGIKNKKYGWMYQFYTDDFGGTKWPKYAELDVFEVEKDTFGKRPGWNSESEFLYIGYSSVISGLYEKIRNFENQAKREEEETQRYFREDTEYTNMILNMAKDFGTDCPSEIKEKLVEEYNKCEDVYKSDFHILPNIPVTKQVV